MIAGVVLVLLPLAPDILRRDSVVFFVVPATREQQVLLLVTELLR